MIVLFTKNKSISSKLIRLVTWSPWSHVAIVNETSIESLHPETDVIDSTFLGGGVKLRPLKDLLEQASEWAFVEVEVSRSRAWAAAVSQVGKPYDWAAIVGIYFHRRWEDTDKWFCNELVEWCLAKAGKARFREDISRLTPGHSWMLETNGRVLVESKHNG
jgi:hypothetical protein